MPVPQIWLDCDPGHDDAMAIVLAGHSPTLCQLLGVSVVAGNQDLDKVTQNALDVLDAAGLSDVEVVAGQAKPLLRPSAILCPEIHGDTGLDGPQGGRLLPRSTRAARPGKAVNFMWEAISRRHAELGGTQRIQLVCTGSLTNAAVLVTLYPEVIPMVAVTIMGGAMGEGNTGAVAEFNIQTDPEAAHVLFNCGVSLTMVPLEVTHTVLVTPDILSRLSHPPTPPAQAQQGQQDGAGVPAGAAAATPFRFAVQQLLLFFADTYRTVFGFDKGPPLHDPCAVAYVLAPHLFKVRELRVDIETQSALSFGQTVCDVWRQSGKPPNCRVAVAVDVPALWQLLLAAVDRADQASPLNSKPQQ